MLPRYFLLAGLLIAALVVCKKTEVPSAQKTDIPPVSKKKDDKDVGPDKPDSLRKKSGPIVDPKRFKEIISLYKNVFPSLSPLNKAVRAAVVNIYSTQAVQNQPMLSPFMEEEPFGGTSLGTGFIINAKGYILTNSHMIKNAVLIKVRLLDNRDFKAKVIGTDDKLDIALLKIETKEALPTVILGNSDQLEVGDWVVAIGNPFGLSYTITQGIVSAKERAIGMGPYDHFIQTDARINQGNSGGPLFNMKGEVVGINTAIQAQANRIGFAIPINTAKMILPQLKQYGRLKQVGFLGLVYAEKLVDSGIKIIEVLNNSPAQKGGLIKGDIIFEINSQKVNQANQLARIVALSPQGTRITLKIKRDTQLKTLSVFIAIKAEAALDQFGAKRLAITVARLSEELQSRFQNEYKFGVMIIEVEPKSIGEQSGLMPGDIIIGINSTMIRTLKEFVRIYQQLPPRAEITLILKRDMLYEVDIQLQ